MGKEDKKIQCPKCDFLVGEDSRFCGKCGSFVEEKADTLTYTPPLEKINRIARVGFRQDDISCKT